MKKIDLSKVFELEFVPHSIRLPRELTQMIAEDAKNHGRKPPQHHAAIIAAYFIEIGKTDVGK